MIKVKSIENCQRKNLSLIKQLRYPSLDSGRQSLTRLTAHIQDYVCFQIELSGAYTVNDWRDDVKRSMMKAGMQNQLIVFLFSDTQVSKLKERPIFH